MDSFQQVDNSDVYQVRFFIYSTHTTTVRSIPMPEYESLDPEECAAVLQLLCDYSLLGPGDLGCTVLVQHHIHTGEAGPKITSTHQEGGSRTSSAGDASTGRTFIKPMVLASCVGQKGGWKYLVLCGLLLSQ